MNHTPVLLQESLDLLFPATGETVIDVTLGLGGHASAFFERIGRKGKLIGLDADKENLDEAGKKLSGKNVALIHANFKEIASLNLLQCDVLFADLGLSSPHLDDPTRGFSFRENSPLDCRFDRSQGITASELIQQSSEEELAHIFKQYGELERAYSLARAIKKSPPKTTYELVAIAEECFTWRTKKMLPRIFQALRISVNDEIGALENLLQEGPSFLKSGGRMGIISFHSLEDRMVKERFRALSAGSSAQYNLMTKKPVLPTVDEVELNPRSRSAKLRVICKL